MRRRLAIGIAVLISGSVLLLPPIARGGPQPAPLAAPIGTAFTYQGELKLAGVSVNGTCDLQFSLYDAQSGGSQIGTTQTASGVSVANGLFTVPLDFGASAFTGSASYLQVAASCPPGSGAVTFPRQAVTATPYAIFAESVANGVYTTGSYADPAFITSLAGSKISGAVAQATNATTAANFSGSLSGDVTGTQGATTVARLQNRTVANSAPNDGDVLSYNQGAGQWQPTAQTSARDFMFATSTLSQPALANLGTLIIFNNIVQADGWVFIPGNDTFICPQSGLYLVQYDAHVTSTSNNVMSVQATQNQVPIAGSDSATLVTTSGQQVSKSFMSSFAAGDTLALLISGSQNGDALTPALTTSASITITRVK